MSDNHQKLEIGFPKSSEDKRLQLIEVNGSIFAIIHSPLESSGPISLLCDEWSLVLLAPIRSKTHITISGINVICLSEITSDGGNVNIHASHRLVKFTPSIKSEDKLYELGEKGVFEYVNDPGALLYFYRLFTELTDCVRSGSPSAIADAQQKTIIALCTLADKIEGKNVNLDIPGVLKIWNIPFISFN